MTDEKNLGLNTGDATPTDGGQSGEQTTSDSFEDLSKELDGINLEDSTNDVYELDDGETVILSKAKVEKLISNKDNYKKGLLGLKEKFKNGKPIKKEQPKEAPAKSDFLSKSEFYKSIEKEAIEKACEDAEIGDNWKDIIKYYTPRNGRDTVDSVMKDIGDAKSLWSKYKTTAVDNEDKKSKSTLAAETGKPEGATTGNGEKKTRTHIIPRRQPVSEWYPKVEK